MRQAELLFASINRNIARTGDNNGFALEGGVVMLEHNLCVVAKAIACGFGANKRTTVVETFAGKNAVVLINYSLVLAER